LVLILIHKDLTYFGGYYTILNSVCQQNSLCHTINPCRIEGNARANTGLNDGVWKHHDRFNNEKSIVMSTFFGKKPMRSGGREKRDNRRSLNGYLRLYQIIT
jgi:hypothetical protein